MPDIKEVLKEYVETANNPQYNNDWNVINSKFPELKGYDAEVLKEYVETANNSSYNNDWNVINSKFPELFTVKKKSKSVASSTPVQSASKPSGQNLRNDMPVFTGFTNDQLNKIEESAKSTTYMGKVVKKPEKKNTWVSNTPVVQETKQAIVSNNPNVNNELKAKQMMEYTSLALFNNTNTFGLKEPNRADYKTDVDYTNAVESYKAEIQKQRDAALTKLADEHLAENNLPEEQKKAVVETYWANKRVSDINQNLIKTGEIDKQIESLKRERASLESRYKEIGLSGAINPALDAESTRIAERMNSIDATIKDLNSEAIKHQSLASREYAKNYVYSISLEEARREIENKPNKTELDITKLGEINTALSVYNSVNRTYEGVFNTPQQNQEYAESTLEKSGAVAGSFNERTGEILSSGASVFALGELGIARLLYGEDFANRLDAESVSRRYDEALSSIVSFDVESLHKDDYKPSFSSAAENIRAPFKYSGKPINPNDIGWSVASGFASMIPDIATVGMLTKSANAVKGVSTLEELAAAVKPSSQMYAFSKYTGVLETANTIHDEMEKGNMSPLSIANKSLMSGGNAFLSMLAMEGVMGKVGKLAEGAENSYLTNLSKKYGTELIMNSKGSIIKAKAIGVGVKLATEPAAMVAVSAPFELITTGDISTNNAAHNFGTGLAFSLMGLPSIGRSMFSSATHTTYVAEPKLIKETLKAIREKKLTTDELLNLEAELLTKADEFNTLGQTYKAKPLIDAAQILQNIRNIKVMGDTYIAEPKVVEDVLTVQKHPSVEMGTQQQEKLKIFEEYKKEVEKRDKEISAAQDRLNLPKEINIILSSETENTLNTLKTKEPIINDRLKSASDELYSEYKKLEVLKSSAKREYTIDQIEQKQNEIGDKITILENRINRQKKTGEFRGNENIEMGRGKNIIESTTNEQKAAEVTSEVKPIETINEPIIGEQQNAIQEPATTENVSRTGETGENITQNSEGVGQKVEGEKVAKENNKEKVKTEDVLRSIADKVDSGKINKLGGFRSSTGFDAVWDGSLSVLSASLRGGANIAESIRSSINHIKGTDWYKGLKKNEKENFIENYWKHIYKEIDVADERGSIDKLRDKLETISKVTKSDLKKFDSLVSDKDKLASLKNRMKQIKAATDAITNIAYSLPLGDVAKKDLRRIKTIINDLQRKGNYTEIDFNNAVQEVKNISNRIMNDAALTKLSTEVSSLMTKQGRSERNRKSVITPEDKSYYSEMKIRLNEIKKQDKIANSNDPDSFKETEANKFETNLVNDILSTQNAIEEATSINEKKKLASQLNAMIDAYDIYNGDALSRMSKLESISDNIENSIQKRLEQVEKQNAWKKDVVDGILKNAKLGSGVDKGKIRQEQQGIGLQQEKKRNIFSKILQKSGFTRIIANQFMLYGMIENRGSRIEDGVAWEHFVNGDNGIVRRRSQYEYLKTKRIEEETKIADKLGLGTKDFASRNTVKKKTGIERLVYGKYVEQQMSIDQAMLLYATSKNANSMARMDEMGWTEQSVSQAKEFLGKKWVDYVDEVMKIDESDGARYNKKHIEMFGFEMKVLENYAARKSQQMIGDGIMSAKGFNTIHLMPGALNNRVRNANIDFTDGFIDTRESSKHEMELWFHFGDWAKQHDIYFRDKDLYNHIMATNPEYLGMIRDNISSILGTGSVERQTLLLKASRNLAYGYLALNLNAAFKQGVGLVNWASKSDIGNEIGLATDMVKISTVSLVKDWKWMKQNIPQFASRVQSSSIGLDGLMRMMEAGKSKSTIGNYTNSAREWALKAGIKPNVVMDALTNVIGGKAYYNQQFKKYSKIMSSDKANQKAIDDVSRAINDINSSLYPEYMSPSQRSLVGKLSGTFANPSLTMLRAATKGAMDLRPIYNRAKSEYIKQGYSSKAASAKATMSIASKPGFESIRNYIIFSSVAPVLWNYMSNYQPLTDLDNEDKRNYVKAATLGYAYNIQFAGDVLKSMAEGRFSPELNNVGVKATEDYMKQIILDYKLNGEINEDVLKSVAKFSFVIGTGVQYDRLSDMIVGLYDAIKNTKDGDYERAALDFAKFMSVPKYVRKEIIEKQFGNFDDYASADEYLSAVEEKIKDAKDINGEPLRKKNDYGNYFNKTDERNIKAYFRMYQHSESELMEFVEKYYGVPSDASSREIGKEASNIVKIVNLQNIADSKGLSLKGIMDSMEDYGFDFSDDFIDLANYIIENKLEGASVSTLKEKTSDIKTKKKEITE